MIVFVDDEERYVDVYIDELRDSGYTVELKTDVDSAIQFLRENHKDVNLLILDIMMPAGREFQSVDTRYGLRTGVLFYAEIKKLCPQLPVIILTNVNREELDPEICKEEENCLILQKADIFPLNLVQEVEKMLKSR